MTKPLEGRTAVITGASGGLGLHFARVLSNAGAKVALTARRAEKIEAGAQAIRDAGGEALALSLDVADAAAIGPALDKVEAELGPISIMVNNAGVSGEGRALDLSIEDWDDTFAVNVRGVFFGAQQAAKRMIANGTAAQGIARIVNIGSIASHTVLPGLVAYCASKASVGMMTQALAREWARQGIAVNALCPGYIETDINADWFKTEGGLKQIKGFPRRRLMDQSDLDDSLLLLAGDGARKLTGILLTVDDGQSLPG